MKQVFGFIYKITCLSTRKVYVGKTTQLFKRMKSHYFSLSYDCHYNKKLQNAFNKYGEQNFEYEVIYSFVPIEYLSFMELSVMLSYDCIDNGMNISRKSEGGNGGSIKGRKRPQSEKDRISKTMKERKISFSNFMKGVETHARNKSLKYTILNSKTNEIFEIITKKKVVEEMKQFDVNGVYLLRNGSSKNFKLISKEKAY